MFSESIGSRWATMAEKHTYTAEEIDKIRSIMVDLNLGIEAVKIMSTFELALLKEKMLNTYLSQGIRHNDLLALYQKKLDEEKLKKNL